MDYQSETQEARTIRLLVDIYEELYQDKNDVLHDYKTVEEYYDDIQYEAVGRLRKLLIELGVRV